VFGKVGVASLKTDLEARIGTVSGADDDTATDVAWGLGIGWKVAPRWLVQLEYERFRPEVQGEKAWVQFTSLGVVYRF
jgi:opacity protein-like surface antigen